jgi:hypothetical protein
VLIIISLSVVLGFGISAAGSCAPKSQIHFYTDYCDTMKDNTTSVHSYFCRNVSGRKNTERILIHFLTNKNK